MEGFSIFMSIATLITMILCLTFGSLAQLIFSGFLLLFFQLLAIEVKLNDTKKNRD